MRSILLRLLRSPIVWSVVPSLLLLELVVLGGFYLAERSRLQAIEKDVTYGNSGAETPAKRLWKFELRGLRKPRNAAGRRGQDRRWGRGYWSSGQGQAPGVLDEGAAVSSLAYRQ